MSFSERNGIEVKTIQFKDVDSKLRNRIINALYRNANDSIAGRVLDKLGMQQHYYYDPLIGLSTIEENKRQLVDYLQQCKWNELYDAIEYCFIEYKLDKATKSELNRFTSGFNIILEEEKSGYRLVDGLIVPITNEQELSTLNSILNHKQYAASRHIKKALELYSDRLEPDYENSIKESISAVESICSYITGTRGKNNILPKTIKKLEDHGCTIHPCMINAFTLLYNYTSDESGIRHGGIELRNAPAEDAKFMLIACSAFVNYLLEKHSKYTEDKENG